MLKFPNPTKSQILFLHTLEGLLGSALLAGFTAGGQQLWLGKPDVKVVITVGISAFFASLLKGYTTSVKPADQFQAVLDTIGELQNMLMGLLQQPAPQTVVVAQQTTARPAPQPIVLPTVNANPSLNQAMQWGIQTVPTPIQNPQEIPAVKPANVTQLPTQPTPAMPSATSVQPTSNLLQFAPIDRHFGDTGIVPSIPPTGQGS